MIKYSWLYRWSCILLTPCTSIYSLNQGKLQGRFFYKRPGYVRLPSWWKAHYSKELSSYTTGKLALPGSFQITRLYNWVTVPCRLCIQAVSYVTRCPDKYSNWHLVAQPGKLRIPLVSQARPDLLLQKGLVNCVCKPCPDATAYTCCVLMVWSNHVTVLCHMTHYLTVWVALLVVKTATES